MVLDIKVRIEFRHIRHAHLAGIQHGIEHRFEDLERHAATGRGTHGGHHCGRKDIQANSQVNKIDTANKRGDFFPHGIQVPGSNFPVADYLCAQFVGTVVQRRRIGIVCRTHAQVVEWLAVDLTLLGDLVKRRAR